MLIDTTIVPDSEILHEEPLSARGRLTLEAEMNWCYLIESNKATEWMWNNTVFELPAGRHFICSPLFFWNDITLMNAEDCQIRRCTMDYTKPDGYVVNLVLNNQSARVFKDMRTADGKYQLGCQCAALQMAAVANDNRDYTQAQQ